MIGPFELLQLGAEAFQAVHLWGLILAGVVIGIIFGVIPGVHGTVAVILFLPFTFFMPLIDGLVLLASIYCGGVFGGSVSAILINVPGSPCAVCTTFDGYPMTQKGQAGKALGAAITVSALGGFMGALVFVVAAPPLASIALKFASADYFGLLVMGLVIIAAVSGKSLIKGLLSGLMGILIGTVGIAHQSGEVRFAFEAITLQAGVVFIAVMIGVFAIGQILARFSEASEEALSIGKYRESKVHFREFWTEKFNIIRSWLLGTLMGFVPGLGATLASFVCYGAAKSMSRHPEEFGTGKLSGVIAPETGNNAATGGAMIPLLTLGIPGGTTTAVMLAVFLFKGVQVGPLIFLKQPGVVGAIMISMLVANLFMFLVATLAMPLFVKVLKLNYAYLVAIGGLFCLIGSFTLRNLMVDLFTALVAGLIGYYWIKHDFPRAPFILGLVLGPMAEFRFTIAMLQHNGSLIGVMTSPIGMVFWIIGLGFLLPPIIGAIRGALRKRLAEKTPPKISLASPFIYLVLMGIALYLWQLTGSWVKVEGQLGPEVWPRIALAGIMILSVVIIVNWIINYRSRDSEWVSGKSFFMPDGIRTFLPMIGFVGYFLLQDVLGFVVASLLFCMYTLYLGRVRPLKLIGVSVLATGFVLYMFVGLMYLPLPNGVAFFGDFHQWLYTILIM